MPAPKKTTSKKTTSTAKKKIDEPTKTIPDNNMAETVAEETAPAQDRDRENVDVSADAVPEEIKPETSAAVADPPEQPVVIAKTPSKTKMTVPQVQELIRKKRADKFGDAKKQAIEIAYLTGYLDAIS